MAKSPQSQPDTLILEGLKIGPGFSGNMMAWPKLAKVAIRFDSDIFVAGAGVAINAKTCGLFVMIFDDYVTVGARGHDATAAVNAVAAFLTSETGDRE